MAYTVRYEVQAVWMGRTENAEYFLHRAMIRNEEEGWELPGYTMWASYGRWGQIAESYADIHLEPGNGLSHDLIVDATATNRQLPPANIKDVQQFAELFRKYCEANGEDLLESEILI